MENLVYLIDYRRKSQLSHTAAPPPSKPNRRPPKKEFVRPKEKENQPPEPAPLPKSTSVVQDKGHLVSLSELLQNTNVRVDCVIIFHQSHSSVSKQVPDQS